MTQNETLAWLRLQRVPGIGPVNGRKLVQYFGDVQFIFNHGYKDLMQLPGVGHVMASNLLNPKFQGEAEAEYLKTQQKGIRCLTLSQREFPELLRECADAPFVLFQKGPLEFSGSCLLSVVGTRNMTDYGSQFCEQFLESLIPYNPVIISGLAYGIDMYAQRIALRKGFRTVSCLGHGLDSVYPTSHAKYVPEIIESGALLSEFWLGTTPEPMNFVRRNRIIAGLSPATVVVESGLKGGSLITADLAFGYDRDVYAVPGRISDPFSSGCNLLIRQQKAQLLHSVQQLAEALGWSKEDDEPGRNTKRSINTINPDLSAEELQICEYLSEHGIQFLDEIAQFCSLTIREAAALLFQMEMKDIIRPHPGKKFELVLH